MGERFYPCHDWYEEDFLIVDSRTNKTRVQVVEALMLEAWRNPKALRHATGVASDELGVRGRSLVITAHQNPEDPVDPWASPLVLHNPRLVGTDRTEVVIWTENGVRVERPASCLVEFLTTDYRLTDHVFFGVQAAAVQMHLEFLEGNHLRLIDRRN